MSAYINQREKELSAMSPTELCALDKKSEQMAFYECSCGTHSFMMRTPFQAAFYGFKMPLTVTCGSCGKEMPRTWIEHDDTDAREYSPVFASCADLLATMKRVGQEAFGKEGATTYSGDE